MNRPYVSDAVMLLLLVAGTAIGQMMNPDLARDLGLDKRTLAILGILNPIIILLSNQLRRIGRPEVVAQPTLSPPTFDNGTWGTAGTTAGTGTVVPPARVERTPGTTRG